MSVDTLEFWPHLVELYVWWTQLTASYYRFTVPVPQVEIPSESPSSPMDVVMSSAGSDSSSDDSKASPYVLISPWSMPPDPQVPLSGPYRLSLTKTKARRVALTVVDLVDLESDDEEEDSEEDPSIEEDLSMEKKYLMKGLLGEPLTSDYTSFLVQLTLGLGIGDCSES